MLNRCLRLVNMHTYMYMHMHMCMHAGMHVQMEVILYLANWIIIWIGNSSNCYNTILTAIPMIITRGGKTQKQDTRLSVYSLSFVLLVVCCWHWSSCLVVTRALSSLAADGGREREGEFSNKPRYSPYLEWNMGNGCMKYWTLYIK